MAQRLFAIAAALSMGAGLFFLFMLPPAYGRYSSIGLDFERPADAGGKRWVYRYVRLRWQGDGSLYVGGDRTNIPALDREPDRVDLGARFFRPPRPVPE